MAKLDTTCYYLAAPNLRLRVEKSTLSADVLLARARNSLINPKEALLAEITIGTCTPLLVKSKNELSQLNESQLLTALSKQGSKPFHPSQQIVCNVVSSGDLADEIKDALLFLDRCTCTAPMYEQELLLLELSNNPLLLSSVRACIGNPSRSFGLAQSDAIYLFGLPNTTAAARVKAAKERASLISKKQEPAEKAYPVLPNIPSQTTSQASDKNCQEPAQPSPGCKTPPPAPPLVNNDSLTPATTDLSYDQAVASVKSVYAALQNADVLDNKERKILNRIKLALEEKDNFHGKATVMAKYLRTQNSLIIQTALGQIND